MPTSRIDCIHIRKPNCLFYDDDRLCPDNCVGFTPTETVASNTISVEVEETFEEEKPIVGRHSRS